ncbi:MAG: hypothetical protein IT209_07235 [Armatimonadetes bacterium]|nr:hypothetical protein [Armatimonadota bacterium]
MNSDDLILPYQRRLLTGFKWADWTLGFVFALIGPFLMCFPPVIAYFMYRDRLPTFGRGIWAGLLALLAITFAATVLMLATHPHKLK